MDESGEGILTAILIGALIGGIIAGGFSVAGQISNNGWDVGNWDWTQIGISTLGGVVAGGISAIPIGGWVGAIAFGGIGAVSGGLITGAVNSFETAAIIFGVGAFANLVGYGISNAIAKTQANFIYNLSNKAKSLAVQQLQMHPLNMGSVALKGSYRNAFKNISQQEIRSLLVHANPWLRNGVYSSFFASLLSGWC